MVESSIAEEVKGHLLAMFSDSDGDELLIDDQEEFSLSGDELERAEAMLGTSGSSGVQ